jgi:hypothetical protein
MLQVFYCDDQLWVIDQLYWYDCVYSDPSSSYIPHREMLAHECVEYLYEKALEKVTYENVKGEEIAYVEQHIEKKTYENKINVDWLILFDSIYEKIHDCHLFYTENNITVNLPARRVW